MWNISESTLESHIGRQRWMGGQGGIHWSVFLGLPSFFHPSVTVTTQQDLQEFLAFPLFETSWHISRISLIVRDIIRYLASNEILHILLIHLSLRHYSASVMSRWSQCLLGKSMQARPIFQSFDTSKYSRSVRDHSTVGPVRAAHWIAVCSPPILTGPF